jgi:hypothetical protein
LHWVVAVLLNLDRFLNQELQMSGAVIRVPRRMLVAGAAPISERGCSATEETNVTPRQALQFVETNGVVLESGRGPVPSLAAAVAGEPIHGSWWEHPKGRDIFRCSRAVRDATDILVCRLVNGKITYVHRRLWPALARLAERFPPDRLTAIREVHTPSGGHEVRETAFADWLPDEVRGAAEGLTDDEATSLLWVALETKPHRKG